MNGDFGLMASFPKKDRHSPVFVVQNTESWPRSVHIGLDFDLGRFVVHQFSREEVFVGFEVEEAVAAVVESEHLVLIGFLAP